MRVLMLSKKRWPSSEGGNSSLTVDIMLRILLCGEEHLKTEKTSVVSME
jgi:hypothetical protein